MTVDKITFTNIVTRLCLHPSCEMSPPPYFVIKTVEVAAPFLDLRKTKGCRDCYSLVYLRPVVPKPDPFCNHPESQRAAVFFNENLQRQRYELGHRVSVTTVMNLQYEDRLCLCYC